MSEPDVAEQRETAVTSDTIDSPLLVVDGLRKEFGGVVAVDGATFSVAEGSLTGLIGPNGAGKSTTFNCITGIHEPTGGRVTFDGQNITGSRRTHSQTRDWSGRSRSPVNCPR